MTTSRDDGLCCRHGQHIEAARERDNPDAATRNTTDLRRAREHARAVVRSMEDEIEVYVTENAVRLLRQEREAQMNQVITRLSARKFRNALLAWLEDRRLTTMARAIRAAFDLMQQVFDFPVSDVEFPGVPTIQPEDRALNRELTQIDAGLLYQGDQSLADEVGNRITRALREGFALNETGEQLAERVENVLTDMSAEGMTVLAKTEMMAHDSIQDAYNTAAHRRYLTHGFRYAIYDATVDFKTSDLCLRFNEHVIDLVDNPALVPPNHPYCRSGIRPLLELGDRSVLEPNEVSNNYLDTIYRNAGFRPKVINTEQEYRPTRITQQLANDTEQ